MTCCLPHRRPAFRKRRVAAFVGRRAFCATCCLPHRRPAFRKRRIAFIGRRAFCMTCCLPHRRPAFRKRRVTAIIVRRAFARPVVCRTVLPSANAAPPLSSVGVPSVRPVVCRTAVPPSANAASLSSVDVPLRDLCSRRTECAARTPRILFAISANSILRRRGFLQPTPASADYTQFFPSVEFYFSTLRRVERGF